MFWIRRFAFPQETTVRPSRVCQEKKKKRGNLFFEMLAGGVANSFDAAKEKGLDLHRTFSASRERKLPESYVNLVLQEMPQPVKKNGDIVPGDLFEDCRYHPCLCYDIDEETSSVYGISLIDGSTWQCCVSACGVRKLTPAEAWKWKSEGPADVEFEEGEGWW